MALRNPIYLDADTLLAHAEYNDVPFPHEAEIVEKAVRKRSGGGKIGISGFGANLAAGSDVELQSTYTLAPKEKATVSKVIDGLIQRPAVTVSPDETHALSKDLVVELNGQTRITAASLVGKMFYVMRMLMDSTEGDIEAVLDMSAEDDEVSQALKRVYLQNELLPVPVLLELKGSSLPIQVYVNVRPDHFIDQASADRVEGDLRVLGSVRQLIPDGDEGYFSSEEWLLHGWEHMLRRTLMASAAEQVKELVEQLPVDLPNEDVYAYISGPAVIVDAIAIY
ncbi:hypothetical protein ABZ234_02285 [Nocardiopsis sp. NPDC006198]|uniref:DUF6414 family protein n=1 Tax=Nocardiopsis sp. NPDC006198 TaxID=3154472 RepID=UPI0033BD73C6